MSTVANLTKLQFFDISSNTGITGSINSGNTYDNVCAAFKASSRPAFWWEEPVGYFHHMWVCTDVFNHVGILTDMIWMGQRLVNLGLEGIGLGGSIPGCLFAAGSSIVSAELGMCSIPLSTLMIAVTLARAFFMRAYLAAQQRAQS